MNKFDVIIAGCGPAGMAAAHVLCSAGMRTALVDKCTFPRDKLCGGLLSGRARTVFEGIFGEAWGPAIEAETCCAGIFGRRGMIRSMDNAPPLYLTSRRTFDAYLLELTRKRGPHLFLGSPAVSVDAGSNSIALKDGTVLRSDFIIGADGVTSRIRSGLFPGSFRKESYALCLQADVPRHEMKRPGICPEVYFGFIEWGYGWVFPKKESFSVGIGGWLSRNRDMKNTFSGFYRHIVGKEPGPVRGHYMPFGNYMETPGTKNILLAGDAAGLVDPITGEGIAFAMESGRFAAESILDAARAGDPGSAYDFYKKKYDAMIRFFKPARFIRRLLFPGFCQRRFIDSMSRVEGKVILESYLNVIAGRKDYYGFLRTILPPVLKGLVIRRRESVVFPEDGPGKGIDGDRDHNQGEDDDIGGDRIAARREVR